MSMPQGTEGRRHGKASWEAWWSPLCYVVYLRRQTSSLHPPYHVQRNSEAQAGAGDDSETGMRIEAPAIFVLIRMPVNRGFVPRGSHEPGDDATARAQYPAPKVRVPPLGRTP